MKWCMAVLMTLSACSPLTPFQDGGAGGSSGGGGAAGSGGEGGGLAGGGVVGGGLVGGGDAGGASDPDAGCDCVAPANGVPRCTPGGCDFSCQPGFHRCGARCVVDDSVLECGPACMACPANGGTPRCVRNACDFACEPTQARCNGQCVPESDVACGNDCLPCEVGSRCRSGVCVVSCPPGQALVAGTCRRTGRDVAVGLLHACARHDGGVACWGTGVSTGALGRGQDAGREPGYVRGLGESVGVWAGDNFACSVELSGAVSCWGSNQFGQLGNGGTENGWEPQRTLSSGATTMTAGARHACAVLGDGGVVGWGTNVLGQLGIGTMGLGVRVPTAMILDGGVELVAAADEGTWVLSPGRIRFTGSQLYTFGQVLSTVPTPVAFDAGMQRVAGSASHGCAITPAGTVWCWGRGVEGQLGAAVGNSTQPPRVVVGLEQVVDLCTAQYSTCVLVADGGVRCFGEGSYGQLGGGNFVSATSPVEVLGLPPARQIACGFNTACASTNDGVWCWGDNTYGQLGVPNPSSSNRPIRVPLP